MDALQMGKGPKDGGGGTRRGEAAGIKMCHARVPSPRDEQCNPLNTAKMY